MRSNRILAAFAFVVAIIAAGLAHAAPGYTTGNVNMRAGPGTSYPVVTTLPAGAPVEIFGCVKGWSWCDTVWGGERGWVSGAYLNAAWQGATVPFVAYAPRLGVPVVAYNPNAYYQRYYVGRPWYPRANVYVGPNHACIRGRYGNVACR